jgi:DNA mismatch repair protein MutS
MANRSMEVLEKGEKIVFLRKLKDGPTAESYGIHVARLAGLSQEVLQRAGQIMSLLKERDADLSGTFENDDIDVNSKSTKVNSNILQDSGAELQKDVKKTIDKSVTGKFEKMLHEIDPEQLTPLEALNILCQWKKLVNAVLEETPAEPQNRRDRKGKKEEFLPSLFD